MSFRLNPVLVAAARARSKRTGVPVSQIMEDALHAHLVEDEDVDPAVIAARIADLSAQLAKRLAEQQ